MCIVWEEWWEHKEFEAARVKKEQEDLARAAAQKQQELDLKEVEKRAEKDKQQREYDQVLRLLEKEMEFEKNITADIYRFCT